MKEVNDCFYYIPLLKSLQSLLRIECVRDQVNVPGTVCIPKM